MMPWIYGSFRDVNRAKPYIKITLYKSGEYLYTTVSHPSEVTMDASCFEELNNSPLFYLSAGSKELFHSDFLYWPGVSFFIKLARASTATAFLYRKCL